MSRIPEGRKVTYYIGMGMIVVGVILFLSVFVSVAGFVSRPFSGGGFPSFTNAIFGFILIAAGGIVSNIGAKGAAGSGLILDPDQAREDLKPFNEARGGMINDVISNIDVVNRFADQQNQQNQQNQQIQKEVIKIKCRSCRNLNDEDAKYCKSCGQLL